VDTTARPKTKIMDTLQQAKAALIAAQRRVLSISQAASTEGNTVASNSTANTAHQAMALQRLDNTASKAIMILTVRHLPQDSMVSNPMASNHMVRDRLHNSTDMDSNHLMIRTDSHMISTDNMGRNLARTIPTHRRTNMGNNLLRAVLVSKVVKDHHLGMDNRASSILLHRLAVSILLRLAVSTLHLAADNTVKDQAVTDSNPVNNILVAKAILVKDTLGSLNTASMGNKVVEDMVDSRAARRSLVGKCSISKRAGP
jgi:hypothetical protein